MGGPAALLGGKGASRATPVTQDGASGPQLGRVWDLGQKLSQVHDPSQGSTRVNVTGLGDGLSPPNPLSKRHPPEPPKAGQQLRSGQ